MTTTIDITTPKMREPIQITPTEAARFYRDTDADEWSDEIAAGMGGADLAAGVLLQRALDAGVSVKDTQSTVRQCVYILADTLDPKGSALAALAGALDERNVIPYDRDHSPWCDMLKPVSGQKRGTPTEEALEHAILIYREMESIGTGEDWSPVDAVASVFACYAECGTAEERAEAYGEALDHLVLELRIMSTPAYKARRAEDLTTA